MNNPQLSRHALVMLLLVNAVFATACQKYAEGLTQSKDRADETAALAALHTIAVAERSYSISRGGYGTFAQLVEAGALDARFNYDRPNIRGYLLTLGITQQTDSTSPGSYRVNADPDPSGPPQTGRHFYVDSSAETIHVNFSKPATASDPGI